jgi:hypothetical protein
MRNRLSVEEMIELEENACGIFDRLPQVVQESILSSRDYLVYSSGEEGCTACRESKEAYLCGYMNGLADAGIITYEERDILEKYYTR